jgi:RND family efflux transporter MFP subunit
MSSVPSEVREQATKSRVADVADRRNSEQAWKIFSRAQTAEDYCRSWLVIQSQAIRGVSDGVVVFMKPGTSTFAPIAYYPEPPRDRSHLAEVSEQALREGRGVVRPLQDPDGPPVEHPRYQLALPVRLDGDVRGVVGLEIDWRPERQLKVAMRRLQWGSGWLEVFLRRNSDPVQGARQRMKLTLELVSTLLEFPGLAEGASAFTTELATKLGCDRVVLGVLKGGRIKISAVSHSAQFDHRANLLRSVESAMEEAVDQAETVTYPPAQDNLPLVAHAHELLIRESGAGSAVTFPLFDGDTVVGALTMECPAGHEFDVPTLEICQALAAVAGPIVELKRSSEESLPVHAVDSTVSLWRKIVGPAYPGLKLALVCIAAVTLFLMFATGDFKVSANSSVEGAVQRAITAPINGFVKEAPLRAGDTVKAGQVIGRFDDRDLKLERVKLLSQRDQYLQQYREAMAKHDRAQTAVVGAQVAQAQAQLALTEEQLARTEMVAPFDGFIVTGDLSQNLGSPVERGQVMFEVAPLDGYRVILHVDERDIGHVDVGQHGELAVASMPDTLFPFTVSSITPVNLAKEGRNSFRVEAQLEHATERLRPGMEGVGKILIGERKLVWIWTHSLTDWLRLWAWTWLP